MAVPKRFAAIIFGIMSFLDELFLSKVKPPKYNRSVIGTLYSDNTVLDGFENTETLGPAFFFFLDEKRQVKKAYQVKKS